MGTAYTPQYVTMALETAKQLKMERRVKPGVYLAWRGPNYETPAEVRMSRAMGADMVGMSTVMEVRDCAFILPHPSRFLLHVTKE